MFNLKFVILIAIISNGIMNGEVKHIKIIVKIKTGLFPRLENITIKKNFTIFRKISAELYTFGTSRSDDQTDTVIQELHAELIDQVEYLYEDYSIFGHLPVVAGAVAGHYGLETTTLSLKVEKTYEVCTPVYDIEYGIDDAWQRNVTGKNIVIAIIDVGVDPDHPQLRRNIDTRLSRNMVGDDSNFKPQYIASVYSSTAWTNHGNACAGLAAGVRNLSSNCQPCGCEVAPDSAIVALKVAKCSRYETSPEITIEPICASLAYQQDEIDIYMNPYNFNLPFKRDNCTQEVLKEGYLKGRKTKGNIYVFPADEPGNSFVNNIYTIAVGDTGVNGSLPNKPRVNSATLVSMFGQGRCKSDPRMIVYMHTEGIKSKRPCTKEFGGQSATCAMMSGVIALFLGVNTQLSSRDVKHILVESAFKTGLVEESSFKQNSAGYFYHPVLGFGLPNVTRMIELAMNWTPPSNLISQFFMFNTLRNSSQAHVIVPAVNIAKIEQIEITVSFKFPMNTKTSMTVTSPHNTTSWLFANIVLSEDSNLKNVVFLSNHFWVEDPFGQWTLQILGAHTADVVITKANIQIHGTGHEQQLTSPSEINFTRNYSIPMSEFDGNDTYRYQTNETSHSNSTDSKSDNTTLIVILVVLLVLVVVCVVVVVVWKCKPNKRSPEEQNVQYRDFQQDDNDRSVDMV